MISELVNTIQPYAWGSHDALARLRGETGPTAKPEAELWMGAHPLAPSRLATSGQSLQSALVLQPEEHLGRAVHARYGTKLPFLLKVLAAAAPLSLQAHPSPAQAARGFAADEAAGIPLEAPERNYKDESHKPELLCALTEFWALCGFREVPATLELLGELDVAELRPEREVLASHPDQRGISRVFSGLMQAPAARRRTLAELTTRACRARLDRPSRFAAEFSWGARIGELYPGDVGVVSALLLNLVRLEPGEAIYLPAGNLHAYLGGTGVEIMASSDNVLRGGLTTKHVNVPELLSVLDFRPLPAAPLLPVPMGEEHNYLTPAREFHLSYFELSGATIDVHIDGPEIWLVTCGACQMSADGTPGLTLGPARSAFVSASTAGLRVSGAGRVFRARVAHST